MSCAPSIVSIDDGTTVLDLDGYATVSGQVSRADVGTGTAIIEYADGSAARWTRFTRNRWTLTFSGPAPANLWALDMAATTWTATFPNPDNPGQSITVDVLPARPETYSQDINSATRPWGLTLEEATPS